MNEGYSETLGDHLKRIRKLEEAARTKHDSEMYLEENRETLRTRVNSLEEKTRRLEQDIEMIEFNRRNNR